MPRVAMDTVLPVAAPVGQSVGSVGARKNARVLAGGHYSHATGPGYSCGALRATTPVRVRACLYRVAPHDRIGAVAPLTGDGTAGKAAHPYESGRTTEKWGWESVLSTAAHPKGRGRRQGYASGALRAISA